MVQTVGNPTCVKCDRGSRYNSASLMGNEPFYLVPSVFTIDDLHLGKTWVIFSGSCLVKLIKTKKDLSNVIPKRNIIITIIKGNVSIRME